MAGGLETSLFPLCLALNTCIEHLLCAGTVLATEGTTMDKTWPLVSGGTVIQEQTCPQKLPIWPDMISREGERNASDDVLRGWTGTESKLGGPGKPDGGRRCLTRV